MLSRPNQKFRTSSGNKFDRNFSHHSKKHPGWLVVTLSPTLLKIEIAAAHADALNGDDVLEITHSTAESDLAEVEDTLQNILKGTGTYISELS